MTAQTVNRGTKWTISLTGLTTGIDLVEAIWTVKASTEDTDAKSLVRISDLNGLEYLDAKALSSYSALVAADGAVTADADEGTATIVLKTAAADYVDPGVYWHGLRYIDSSDEEHVWEAPDKITVTRTLARGV